MLIIVRESFGCMLVFLCVWESWIIWYKVVEVFLGMVLLSFFFRLCVNLLKIRFKSFIVLIYVYLFIVVGDKGYIFFLYIF